jgi:hypothetical protein
MHSERAVAARRCWPPESRLHVERLADDETGAVVPVGRRKLDAELDVSLKRDRGHARQHVDLAGLPRGKTLRRGQWRKPDLRGISQHGGGDRAVDVDVEAAPVSLRIGRGKPGDARAHTALDEALAPHAIERGRRAGTTSLGLGASASDDGFRAPAPEHADSVTAKQHRAGVCHWAWVVMSSWLEAGHAM